MELDDAVTKAVKEHDYTLAGDITRVMQHRFQLSYKEVRAWFKQIILISNSTFDKLMQKH